MLMIPMTNNISIAMDFFTTEKSSDVFKEVNFRYDNETWVGVLPKFLQKQGLDLTDDEFKAQIKENYQLLHPSKRPAWILESDDRWPNKESATYKVLAALYTGRWECRVCGPVPKVNPQPAARLRDLKKRGYIIGSLRKYCDNCGQKTMHDILVMLPNVEARYQHGNELRKPMPEILKKRIKTILDNREVCFNIVRSDVELIVDHKFPSQRWGEPESDNPNNMPEAAIKKKFQLLSNQTNMWKLRYCDRCVKTGKRGDYMGIKWYYEGDEYWNGDNKHDEKGCVGCPWYDLEKWKQQLMSAIK